MVSIRFSDGSYIHVDMTLARMTNLVQDALRRDSLFTIIPTDNKSPVVINPQQIQYFLEQPGEVAQDNTDVKGSLTRDV